MCVCIIVFVCLYFYLVPFLIFFNVFFYMCFCFVCIYLCISFCFVRNCISVQCCYGVLLFFIFVCVVYVWLMICFVIYFVWFALYVYVLLCFSLSELGERFAWVALCTSVPLPSPLVLFGAVVSVFCSLHEQAQAVINSQLLGWYR